MKYAWIIVLMLLQQGLWAQEAAPDSVSDWKDKLRLKAYGVVNYYAYDWETYPDKNNAIDPERLNIYTYYSFNDRIEFKSEIEFEHGGTGATMEFDPLEEFGEFEQEIEKGGEVVLEQINLQFKWHRLLNLRVGKMRFYMGNASRLDMPNEYFTPYRSESENTILPLGWYETGIEITGKLPLQKSKPFPALQYYLYLVSGLDNSGFSSANWVRNGYQTRFTTINADALAGAARIDLQTTENNEIGFCFYAGNTTPNRPKEDFTEDAWLVFGDFHATFDVYPFRWRAYGMWGYLQNTEALSQVNKNLSNNLNVKRTPVGKNAGAAYVEAAYDLFHLRKAARHQCYVFGRYEWYDSMLETEGTVNNNPRYDRRIWSGGLNYFVHPDIVLKGSYAYRTLQSGETEKTTAVGIGFQF